MKTLKTFKKEIEKKITDNAKSYFSKGFSKKMGGIEVIRF